MLHNQKMTDKILQKNQRQLMLSKSKRIVFFMLWLLLLCLAGFLYLIKDSILGFLISVMIAHEIWKKIEKIKRKIKLLKMAIYYRELELKKKDFDPKNPQLQEIIKILTPKK